MPVDSVVIQTVWDFPSWVGVAGILAVVFAVTVGVAGVEQVELKA